MNFEMRTDTDCGPAALSAASGLPYEQVMAAWGTFRGNRSDSPWHHDWVMQRLGLRRRIVTCGEIIAGECPPDRTVILVHDWDKSGGDALTDQHWVVLAPGAPPGQIYLHIGDGKVRWYTHDQFRRLYAASTPACAYIVGAGEVPTLSWYQRAWLWLSATRIAKKVFG